MYISSTLWWGVELDDDDLDVLYKQNGIERDECDLDADVGKLDASLNAAGFRLVVFTVESCGTDRESDRQFFLVGAGAGPLAYDDSEGTRLEDFQRALAKQPSVQSFHQALVSWGLPPFEPRLLLGVDFTV